MKQKITIMNRPVPEKFSEENSREKFDAQKKHLEIINAASLATAGIADVESISRLVSKALVDTLGYKISVFQILGQDDLLYFKNVSTPGIVFNLLQKALGMPIYDLKVPLAKRENYLVRAFVEKKFVKDEELHKFARPFVSKRAASIMQKVMRLENMAAMPLLIKNEPIGVLSVGSGKSLEDYEIDFLKTFASQIAIALNNAKLLDEQKAQYQELQAAYKKLEEMHQLQSLDRAKSELIRVASHQFRTPLSGIRFEAEYILEKRERGDLAANEA
ncbi:sensor histidine kinase, partial [Patescibacteria group bacterium]